MPFISGCVKDDLVEPIPPVKEKSISLDATRVDTSVDYDVALKNIREAEFNIYRDGEKLSKFAKTINTQNYSGTVKDLNKGSYELKVKGEGKDASKNVTIPNYYPTIDLEGLETFVKYGSEINWDLENSFNDLNKEDKDKIKIESIISTDGKLDIAVNGYNVNIKPNGNNSGQSQLEIKVGSEEGRFTTKTINIDMEELENRKYSGTLEDNITNAGVLGKINLYEGSISQDNFLGQVKTGANGNFDFEINGSIEGQIIAETIQDGDINKNYTRTINLPEESTLDLIIRPHKLSIEGITKETFRNFMKEINPGFEKWDLDKLKGVEIIDIDPLGRGNFTSEQQNEIETIYKSNIGCYTGNLIKGNEILIQKDNANTPDSERHYKTYENENGTNLEIDKDWIYWTRDTKMNLAGWTGTNSDEKGIINNSMTKIRTFHEAIIAHEQGRNFIAPSGSARSIQKPLTIMEQSVHADYPNPGLADCEAGYVLYDETYYDYPYEGYSSYKYYDDILGMEFHNFIVDDVKVIDNIN